MMAGQKGTSMEKRYFIFRINGIDNGITDDAAKAVKLHELFLLNGFKHTNTELNNLTTTYYFTL
jgi:hypothetical protein